VNSNKPLRRLQNHRRLRPGAGRHRFLETDVTLEKAKEIREYCFRNGITVSDFLAELILEDAATAKHPKAEIKVDDLTLPWGDYEKLELIVYLTGRNSISEFIRELLQPHLDLQRLPSPKDKIRSLRLYLNEEDHRTVTRHLESRGIGARKYISFLALKAIAKARKTPK
jgi:transposase